MEIESITILEDTLPDIWRGYWFAICKYNTPPKGAYLTLEGKWKTGGRPDPYYFSSKEKVINTLRKANKCWLDIYYYGQEKH